jgi:hypothetical protein
LRKFCRRGGVSCKDGMWGSTLFVSRALSSFVTTGLDPVVHAEMQ